MLTSLALLSFAALSARAAVVAKRSDVACETVYTGSLGLYSQDLPAGSANVALFFTSQASAFLATTTAASSEFAFQQCNSSFMGYGETVSGATTTYFGHIVPVDPSESDACLSTGGPTEAGSPYLIFNDECFTTDDSEQLGQYWSLAVDSDSGSTVVTFLGVSADGAIISGDDYVSYSLGVETRDGETAIVESGSTEPNAPSAYTLQFI